MRWKTFIVPVRAETYIGETLPEWITTTRHVLKLEAGAAISDNAFINLAVVNTNKEKSVTVSLDGIGLRLGGVVQGYTAGGEEFTSMDGNSEHEEKIAIKESKWDDWDCLYTFRRLNVTLLKWNSKIKALIE